MSQQTMTPHHLTPSSLATLERFNQMEREREEMRLTLISQLTQDRDTYQTLANELTEKLASLGITQQFDTVVEAKKDTPLPIPPQPSPTPSLAVKGRHYSGTIKQGVEELLEKHPAGLTKERIAELMAAPEEEGGLNYNFDNPAAGPRQASVYTGGLAKLQMEGKIVQIGQKGERVFILKKNAAAAFEGEKQAG